MESRIHFFESSVSVEMSAIYCRFEPHWKSSITVLFISFFFLFAKDSKDAKRNDFEIIWCTFIYSANRNQYLVSNIMRVSGKKTFNIDWIIFFFCFSLRKPTTISKIVKCSPKMVETLLCSPKIKCVYFHSPLLLFFSSRFS